jgi:hypothetical protein
MGVSGDRRIYPGKEIALETVLHALHNQGSIVSQLSGRESVGKVALSLKMLQVFSECIE